jgi:hypothetical protein
MKKTLFFGMCLLLTTWGCSDNEVTEVADSQPTPIQFSTYVQQATRGNVADITTLQSNGFYVFARTVVSEGSTPAEYIENGWVAYSSSGWTSETYYWPATAELNFYAYSSSSSKSYSKNVTYVLHEVEDEVASQVDLLTASVLNQTSKTKSGKVQFQFGHALSRIGVSVTGTDDLQYDVTITDVTIEGKFKTVGTLDLTTGTWSNDDPYKVTTYTLPTEGTSSISKGTANSISIPAEGGNYLMTIPAKSVENFKITLTFTAKNNGVTVTETGKITYDLSSAGPTFEARKAYTYNFELGKIQGGTNNTNHTVVEMPDAIVWDVKESVTDWEPQTATDISVEPAATE